MKYKYNLGIYFEDIVEKFSKNPALKFSEDNITPYDTLNAFSNKLARYLLSEGVLRNDVVCISGDKVLETFAGMIACLKIGAIYTILDPDNPKERMKKILKTCKPKVMLLENKLGAILQDVAEEVKAKIIIKEDMKRKIAGFDDTNLKETKDVTGADPAYIMFTSGSTGFPKGAVMTHANVLNLISWSLATFNFTPEDILTNVNPLYFDNSVFDFYSSIFSGACIVPVSKEVTRNAKMLVEMVDEMRCTSWFSVPSLLIFLDTMKALKKENMKFIKRFIFGGEGYPKSKLKKLFELYSDRAEFFNVYGPTECTCICSVYKITSEDFDDLKGLPPLGRISENFSYLILGGKGEKVKDGEVGELCLLGPNVGKGYYNDLERTTESFVQNPFNSYYPEPMYKTGDLVRYNPEDGKIYFVCRKDNQIKHMGYRIELEEIEAALNCLDYISEAAVLHGTSRGLSQIVAVVATKREVEESQIRQDLKELIPYYMIPTIFHFERELPKNPSGKIDRVKLKEKYVR